MLVILFTGYCVSFQCCSKNLTSSANLSSYANLVYWSNGSFRFLYSPCYTENVYTFSVCSSSAACVVHDGVPFPVGDKNAWIWKDATTLTYPSVMGSDGKYRNLMIRLVCSSSSPHLLLSVVAINQSTIAYTATMYIDAYHCNAGACHAVHDDDDNDSGDDDDGVRSAVAAVVSIVLCIMTLPFFCCCCIGGIALISCVIGIFKISVDCAAQGGVSDTANQNHIIAYHHSGYYKPGYIQYSTATEYGTSHQPY